MAMSWIFLIIAFGAEIIGTVAGFGSSTISLPLALFLFDFQTALVLVAFLHIFGNLGRIGFFRHGIDTRLLLTFGLPSLVFTVLGALLVEYIPQAALKGILGAFLIVYVFLEWRKKLRVRPSNPSVMLGGTASGFFTGLIGTGGALRGAFLTAFKLPKEKYIATSAAIALAVDFTRLPIYFQQGFFDASYYTLLPGIFICAIAGSFAGKLIVKRLGAQVFRNVVLLAIFLVSISFLYSWVRSLIP